MSGAAAEPDVDLDYEDDVQEIALDISGHPPSPLPAARSQNTPAKGASRWAQSPSRRSNQAVTRGLGTPLPPPLLPLGMSSSPGCCCSAPGDLVPARAQNSRRLRRQWPQGRRGGSARRQRRHDWPRKLLACHPLQGGIARGVGRTHRLPGGILIKTARVPRLGGRLHLAAFGLPKRATTW